MNPDFCRLCGGPTVELFRSTVLGKHAVAYQRCLYCESAQTEKPHWLAESYADDRPLTDTGMVVRTLDLSMRTDLILSLLQIPDRAICVDFGGSNGLFTRMMRDKGHNFYRSEPFSQNFYVPFYDAAECGIRKAIAVTAFEVFEHLSEPAAEIAALFEYAPDVLIVGTETYIGQAPDWWYFGPDLGQHVFFYSPKALRLIAERHEMHLFSAGGNFHVFCRKQPRACGYSHEHLRLVEQLLGDGWAFLKASLEKFVYMWVDPAKYARRDRSEILLSGEAIGKATQQALPAEQPLAPAQP